MLFHVSGMSYVRSLCLCGHRGARKTGLVMFTFASVVSTLDSAFGKTCVKVNTGIVVLFTSFAFKMSLLKAFNPFT